MLNLFTFDVFQIYRLLSQSFRGVTFFYFVAYKARIQICRENFINTKSYVLVFRKSILIIVLTLNVVLFLLYCRLTVFFQLVRFYGINICFPHCQNSFLFVFLSKDFFACLIVNIFFCLSECIFVCLSPFLLVNN